MILVTVITTYSIWGEYTLAKTLSTSPYGMPLSVGLTLLKSEVWEYGTLVAVITLAIIPPVTISCSSRERSSPGSPRALSRAERRMRTPSVPTSPPQV